MTPKQILDSFSDTLIQDARILSGPERALLTTFLRHAKAKSGANSQTQIAVDDVIASAVGETIAERAFAVLGHNIVERILETGGNLSVRPESVGTPTVPPEPPHSPEPDEEPLRPEDQPTLPTDPGPPHASASQRLGEQRSLAVLDSPQIMRACSVVLEEFLAPQELHELTKYALEHELDFSASEVVAPTREGGILNYEHRRSSVLMGLGEFHATMVDRVKSVLPEVLSKLDLSDFKVAGVDVQLTASNDGDFFHQHSDNSNEKVASRELTFVYFFHREPRQFKGGELRIHDSIWDGRRQRSHGSYQSIVPQQNQIVFFPCSLLHEITAVECPSKLFADGRFTVNGWLRR